ncbi:MAG: crotonobetainyl-CoA--carnitine CoA-transferase, partial [bacterium]
MKSKQTAKLVDKIITFSDANEIDRRHCVVDMLRHCPIPDSELLLNMGLFVTPQLFSRLLFMDHLYRQVLDIQGVVMEFGCRWGQNLVTFNALRGIYEPYNRLRKIIGFDTFTGFGEITKEDGAVLKKGGYAVTTGYRDYLAALLGHMEKESPLSHIVKHEVIQGDAPVKLRDYLERNPHTVIALAYFDMDVYKPTKECLELIRPHITRGTILGFDEVNDPD